MDPDYNGITDFSEVHSDGAMKWPIEHPWALFDATREAGLRPIAPLNDHTPDSEERPADAPISQRVLETMTHLDGAHVHSASSKHPFLRAMVDLEHQPDIRIYNASRFWWAMEAEAPNDAEDPSSLEVRGLGYLVGKERLAYGWYLEALERHVGIGTTTQFIFKRGGDTY